MTNSATEQPLLENPPEHTLRSRLNDIYEFSLFRMMRLMPTDFASDVGSYVVRRNIRKNLPEVITKARANVKKLRPDWDDEKVEETVYNFQDNVGRMMIEFSVLTRLYAAGRIEITEQGKRDLEVIHDAPTLMMVVHTGNWEVFPAYFKGIGLDIASFAFPPPTWAQRVIASQIRAELGVTILPPNVRGLVRAEKKLADGGVVAIFADEAREGHTMAPLFGRPPHRKGNLAIAAWLARKTGARILAGHCRRLHKSRFILKSAGFIHMPPEEYDSKEQSLADVAFLNDIIEPMIYENLDQWYFLDDALDEI